MNGNRSGGVSQVQAIHRRRLTDLRNEATSLASTAVKITQVINEVLAEGGTVDLEKYLAFITGAHARMVKDWGVVQQLQSEAGARQRRPPSVR